MKGDTDICERESAVLAAAASGEWDTALRAHAHGCPACQEALDIWRYLQLEAQQIDADLDASGVELPHPGLIWWRRRILDQHAAARRALTPITLLPYVAGAMLLVVLSAFALWQWDALSGVLIGAWNGSQSSTAASSASAVPPIGMLMLAAAATVPIAWAVASAWYLHNHR